IRNPTDIHQPISKIVAIENTMNKGGGAIYDFGELKRIYKICTENNLIYHLDGARLFNALVETNETTMQYGAIFDTISICLSKGLGAPVGSLLLGKKSIIQKARRIRKRIGGGWRQAGYLAAAGIYALENNVRLLKQDHENARLVSSILAKRSYIIDIMPVDTNIVICELKSQEKALTFLQKLKENHIQAVNFGIGKVRFVTHLDIHTEDLNYFESILNTIEKL
ncbi:MAG: threonine aldolase family protein, partial [Leadbetterella sp.]